ncbi:RpiB/LacA/LacB family sugar-phosphate isomerase [Candidatus Woesearchaeota archaeon]|nr:RpiB/LacA/LacB family sugar-phosphate isomerase [Candidatus Woesearchaeota archaeon]
MEQKKPKIIIGADHGGYKLKEELKPFLQQLGYKVEDVGTNSEESCDYPDYAFKVSEKVGNSSDLSPFPKVFGILVCRSAAGMIIAANKVKGVRAVAAFDETSARHSREHNAANVLGLSGDRMSAVQAKKVVEAWLETPFSMEERHARRLQKITEFEKKVFK